ncbi:hypothetical protein [Photobacterium damselae]|uniref:Uncharacterized protein n=2 Tax=Photobacterium damselae TaxID=38293 RepID=W8QM82_PHODD|nr:hypothetical protein [Photobacterium damselae]AHL64208.1 hypothetical protein [Photobacterium damselae subsp. damselae]KAB1183808.1 hypothetical protein F6450_02950 [Photobacterium damselae subsp. damselae]MBA5683248.1 hypothetical protein [Photobacterium damselae subsp. damselae]MCG3811393.1 hypothetical protein [Photobacterium damselae]MCG3823361.1 hypothetical protein [Photobacterium damselae]
MVKELLVNETLSDAMIHSGAQLIKQLEDSAAEVHSAFWFYLEEEHTWRLIVVSNKVSEEGPRNYYKRIIDANELLPKQDPHISSSDITVIDLNDPLAKLFTAVTINNDGLRMTKNIINGQFVDDVYLYRMQ